MARHTSKIIIDSDYYLSPPTTKDKPSFVKYLDNKDIYATTLRIPSPYRLEHAQAFLDICSRQKKAHGRVMNWSLRKSDGELIGGIGFHTKYGTGSHKDEIGYWLAKPFWNKGIMSRVLKKFCEHAFKKLGLVRIEATIFEGNKASGRIAEKCGFVLEGTLKKAYFKDGKYFNAKLYALVKD